MPKEPQNQHAEWCNVWTTGSHPVKDPPKPCNCGAAQNKFREGKK